MTLEQVYDSMAPRGGTLNGADKLFPAVEAAYRRTVDALRADPAQQRRSPLDKNPMPGHLSELQPVNAVNTKGQFFRASFGKNPRFQIQLDKRPLSPGTQPTRHHYDCADMQL